MIDSIRAEIDYRQERVRRDVAGSRRTGRKSTGQAERRADRRSGSRATGRPQPVRPAVRRALPQADGPVC
jgi:hypothetical protein